MFTLRHLHYIFCISGKLLNLLLILPVAISDAYLIRLFMDDVEYNLSELIVLFHPISLIALLVQLFVCVDESHSH